ncbi:hypothetical protein HDU97_000182 [Phlyctochytrium planicorne]|nr:hypothetical protein HDU97_000182 [Phlyctochytrium planicorne]
MSKLKGSNLSAFNAATDNKSAKKNAKDGSRRHRLTEKEEDEALLQQEEVDEEDLPPVFTESPAYVKGGTMRDYQLQGLNWLISLYHNGINGVLADEMGLGKTLQSISFLGYLKHCKGIAGKHIIIVPKSTLHNWMTEIKRWVPDLEPFLFHGDKESRVALVKERIATEDFDICVTSYEMCLLEKSALRKISWQCLVIDEAHRIKNENSSLSQIVREFNCRNRLLLTGTPLQNNLHELWALLNFLLPDVFSSSEDFSSWFENRGDDQDQVVAQLHKVLRPFLLRRIKADVEKSLLPKKRTNLYVGMSAMQRKWYQKLLEKDIDAVNGSLGGKKSGGKTRLLNIVMQLRKCCNHPYLFDGAEPGPPFTTDQHLIDNAGKMAILDRLLARLKEKGSRVLLFSQMSRMLDILEDYCVFRGFDYCRIDGNTAHEDRIQSIDEFNKPGSSKFIFLLTTRAGGLGINLATADIVIMYDSDWNPQVDLQAEDRAHRIGQTKQVIVFRFITENAIEEKVIDRATQKLRLDQLVIQQGRQSSASNTITNDDIEDVLRRGEEKTAELDKKYNSMGLDDVKNFMSDGSVYQWEGSDFRSQKKDGKEFRWIQPAKREKRVGSYAVDDYFREALRVGTKGGGPRGPRATKAATTLNDFQFFPFELSELMEKEAYAQKKTQGVVAVKRASTVPEEDDEFLEQERLYEQAKIDSAEPWTEADQSEKEALMQQGFENWTRKDFQAFIKANAEHGRDNIVSIAKDIEGKTFEEVKKYAAAFWSRYKELQDWEKHLSTIEKGEKVLVKQYEVQESLRNKVASTRLPLQQLRFNYGQSRGKNFNEDEDRFMIVCLEKFGYGTDDVYDKIREEIKNSALFRFDWFFKSRTSQEIQRRCQTLIGLIQKEEAEEKEREDKKRKAASLLESSKSSKRGQGAGMHGKEHIIELLEGLESRFDVEVDVLADYVLALLKHDRPRSEMKEKCIQELDDFLKGETIGFVNKLFEDEASVKYQPAKGQNGQLSIPVEGMKSADIQKGDMVTTERIAAANSIGRSQIIEPTQEKTTVTGIQMPKIAEAATDQVALAMTGHDMEGNNSTDRQKTMHRRTQWKDDLYVENLASVGIVNVVNSVLLSIKKIGVTKIHTRSPSFFLLTKCLPAMVTSSYAPDSAIGIQQQENLAGQVPFTHPSPMDRGLMFDANNRGRGRGRGGRGRSGLAPYSVRSRGDTIVVDNIPEAFVTVEKVTAFFKTFGEIVNVRVQPESKRAFVQFQLAEEALRAFRSPEAIFSNRFVRVSFWNTGSDTPKAYPQNANYTAIGKELQDQTNRAEALDTTPLVESAQESLPEKKQASVRTLIDLQKQEEKLLQQQIELKKSILSKLERKDLNAKERALLLETWQAAENSSRLVLQNAAQTTETVKSKVQPVNPKKALLDRELDMITAQKNSTPKDTGHPSSDPSEADLLAKLQSLKAEAIRVGVNPAVALRKGGGALQGGGGGKWKPWQAPSRTFRLDNRTTRLFVKNVPKGTKRATFDQFKFFGELTLFEFNEDDNSVMLQYKLRSDAERAMQTKILVQGNLLVMSWVETSPSQNGSSEKNPESRDGQALGEGAIDEEQDLEAFDDDDDERERGWKHHR